MKNRHFKIIALFSLIIGCFINLSAQSNIKQNDVIETHAKTDYSHLNFEKNPSSSSLPSGYTVVDGSGVDTAPAFDSEGRLNIANGGGSTFSFDSKRPHGKRTTRFTLYENVRVEISMYTTGTGKNFIINDGSSNILSYTAEKSVDTIFQFEFTNVPSTGKTYYFGASSSGIFVNYIEFGSTERIKFDANGGKFADGSTVYKYEKPEVGNTNIVMPGEPTRAGYIFRGWGVSPSSTTTTNSFAYNNTYYAVWTDTSKIILYMTEISVSLDLTDNRSKILTVKTLPDSNLINYITVEWSSNNTLVATVDNQGRVTAASLGSAIITARCGSASTTCKVNVVRNVSHTLTFFGSYEDYKSNVIYSTADVNDKEALGEQSKPTISIGAGYTFVWMADVNNTPDNRDDDVAYDFNSSVTSSVNIYADLNIFPVANLLEITVGENFDGIQTAERDYYIKDIGKSFRLGVKVDRDDNRLEEIEKNGNPAIREFYLSNINDVTWYTSNPEIATVDINGNVTIKKQGKVEIYATLYEHLKTKYNVDDYERHIIVASSLQFSTLGSKIVNGKNINEIDVKVEKGRFSVIGGNTEIAIRTIGIINEELYGSITEASFKVEAINMQNEVQRTFEHQVNIFSKEIDYTSKAPYSTYFKPWSESGKLGTALTITNLPNQEFVGKFKITFIVKVASGEEITAADVTTINYYGV